MEPSAQIRAVVYQVLRKPMQPHTAQLQQVLLEVLRLAHVDFSSKEREEVEDQLREIIWELTFQGIVVPGVDTGLQAGFPWFKITEWGQHSLGLGEYLPYDATLFIERLRKEIPNVDSFIVLYITEALKCFRFGAFTASAVMVGVSAERLMQMLKNAVSNALQTAEQKRKFDSDAQDSIKKTHRATWKKLEPLREQMPNSLGESVGLELNAIFEMTRRTRNEAGHPTGRSIERHEAEALLLLFPTHVKKSYELIAWLGRTKL